MKHDSFRHSFTQSDVDTVRSISDDANPIHDPEKWSKVQNNPFDGPIVLGFQLVELAARATSSPLLHQAQCAKKSRPPSRRTVINRYRVTFLNAVKANETVDIKASATRHLDCGVTTRQRFVARSGSSIVLKGYREIVMATEDKRDDMFADVGQGGERSTVGMIGSRAVMTTEKLLSTTHASRFAKACGDSTHDNNVHGLRGLASDIYPVSMTSGALVRYAISSGWDLSVRPFVYKSQDIRIDSSRLSQMSTSTAITLQTQLQNSAEDSMTDAMGTDDFAFFCTGLLPDKSPLFCVRLVVSALGPVSQSNSDYENRDSVNAMAF